MPTKTRKTNTKTKKPNKNYQLISDRLIALLEQGTKPWQKPWSSTPFGNLIGKNQYNGCNPLLCQLDMMLNNFSTPYFLSYKQAEEKGWQVKKGSKATTLTYAGSFKVEIEKDGKSIEETRFMTKFYKVFNTDCIDDSKSDRKIVDYITELPTAVNPDIPIESLEQFAKDPRFPSVFYGGDRACYSPSQDRISMPEFRHFNSARGYYSTLLHELGHSTGHCDRLNRDLSGSFGSTKYAFEELVAELTSAFTANQLGINEELELENHASYLASWIKVLKADDKAFFKAMSLARSASEYLLNNKKK